MKECHYFPPFKGCSWNSTPSTTTLCPYNTCTFCPIGHYQMVIYVRNKVQYLLGSISSIQRIFLKLHIYHSTLMAYNTCKPTATGLKWRELYFRDKVPCRLYLLFHSRDIPETPYLTFGHNSGKFGHDQSIRKGHLLEIKSTLSASLPFKGCSWNSIPSTTTLCPTEGA